MLNLQTLSIQSDFYSTFIKEDRWKYFVDGLGNTLVITLFAAIIGIILGFIVAVIRSSADKLKKQDNYKSFFGYIKARCSKTEGVKRISAGRLVFYIADAICKLYLIVIRGTPVLVQLLILNFWLLVSISEYKLLIAIIAFGVNSGAYVAEIVRAGIMSIDQGQEEAGRSLGLGFIQTMRCIILPQAFKNVLPALCNEAIVLLKETSISGYIAVLDLTKGGDIIRSLTYNPFPLFVVAAIYLIVVIVLTKLLGILERRMRSSER